MSCIAVLNKMHFELFWLLDNDVKYVAIMEYGFRGICTFGTLVIGRRRK